MGDPIEILCPFGCGAQVLQFENALYDLALDWTTIRAGQWATPSAIVSGHKRHVEPTEPITIAQVPPAP